MNVSFPHSLQASVSLCACVCVHLVGPTYQKFGTHLKDHLSDKFESQGHRLKVKVTKFKNVKIPVFNLVSEKVVQCQGHDGQGQGKGGRSYVKDTGSRSKLLGEFCTPSTHGRCTMQAISFLFETWPI